MHASKADCKRWPWQPALQHDHALRRALIVPCLQTHEHGGAVAALMVGGAKDGHS